MHKSPLVSVLMSVYNGQDFIAKAIDSILCQTFTDFEFLIINDGSTDLTDSIVKSYQDPRIYYLKKNNTGLTSSLNYGIKLSKGKFIARMDSDDFSYPKRLELQVQVIRQNPKIGLVASRARLFDNGHESITPFYTEEQIMQMIKFQNPIVHSSVMISKELFKSVGLYNEIYQTTQDYDAWIRLSEISKLIILDQILVGRIISVGSISRKRYILQAKNSFRIRRGSIPLTKNIYLLIYQVLANMIPRPWIRIIKKMIT